MTDDTQSPIVRFGLGLIAFFLVLGAPISGFFLTRIVVQALASTDWPSVNGLVNKAEVGVNDVGRYYADVSYTYDVDGQSFTGTRVRMSDGEYENRDGAALTIQNLQVGMRLPVHYDPDDPAESVLRPGAGYQEYALLLVPVIMLSAGLYGFSLLWRTRPSRDSSR